MTSTLNSLLLAPKAVSSVLELESRILVISAPRALICWLISSARPTKLRATSALTPSRVRSTSLAFCLSTLLTPVDTPVSTRSTSPALCLIMPLARVDAARIEGLGHGLGPRVDMLVDRIDAADPQVFEAADGLAERTFGLAGDVGDGAFGRVGDLNERALGG